VLFPLGIESGTDQQEHEKFRERLIVSLMQAKGIMLCISGASNTASSVRAIFNHLESILQDVKERCNAIGIKRLVCDRIVFCLTMADLVFIDKGCDAKRAVEKTDPRWYANKKLLLNAVNGMLKGKFKSSTKVGYCWTSVYGFLRTGESNFDKKENRCLFFDGVSFNEMLNEWQPYQLVDPFLFLATGEDSSLTTVSINDI